MLVAAILYGLSRLIPHSAPYAAEPSYHRNATDRAACMTLKSQLENNQPLGITSGSLSLQNAVNDQIEGDYDYNDPLPVIQWCDNHGYQIVLGQ
jgi:hypothetical protein